MDGLKFRGSVIVIGVTNRFDVVDSVLRRFGRFDREIYFLLFLLKDRFVILVFYIRKWFKSVAGFILKWVVIKIVGFVGVDLEVFCV